MKQFPEHLTAENKTNKIPVGKLTKEEIMTIKIDLVKNIKIRNINWDNLQIIIKQKQKFTFKKKDLERISDLLEKESEKRKDVLNKERIKRIANVAYLLTICQNPQKIMELIKISSLKVFISYLKQIDHDIQKLN
jgi:ERCC4-related helicase